MKYWQSGAADKLPDEWQQVDMGRAASRLINDFRRETGQYILKYRNDI